MPRVRTVAQYKLADDWPGLELPVRAALPGLQGQARLRRLPARRSGCAAAGRDAAARLGPGPAGRPRGTSAGSRSQNAPFGSTDFRTVADGRRPRAERDVRAHAAPARGPVPAPMGQRALSRGIDRGRAERLLADRDVRDADGDRLVRVRVDAEHEAAAVPLGDATIVKRPMSSRLWSTLACGNLALICGIVAPTPRPFALAPPRIVIARTLRGAVTRVVDGARQRRLEPRGAGAGPPSSHPGRRTPTRPCARREAWVAPSFTFPTPSAVIFFGAAAVAGTASTPVMRGR